MPRSKNASEGKQRVWLYANQCHRQTLKYLKYWNSAGTERTLSYYRQVDVTNKGYDLFLLYNKCLEIVRVNLQIAVTLLSRYVRRLAAFEKILNEGAKMSIGIKTTSFLAPLYGRQMAQTPRKWPLLSECRRPVQNSLSRQWTIGR